MKEANTQSLTEIMGTGPNEQAARKRFVGFTDEDARALKTIRPLVEASADHIVDKFYANIEHYPELMKVISDAGSNLERLKGAQKRYLLEMFDGE